MRGTTKTTLLVIFALGGPVALACSACIKDIMSLQEFDRNSWDNADNVYVGLITKAELTFPATSMPQVTYSMVAEEIFKGDPDSTGDIQSQRVVNGWDSEVEEISCGDMRIYVGDRLLIFSDAGESVYIGSCSPSRVVDLMNSSLKSETRETISRLRKWRDAL